jgi:hypothetical protein
MNKKRVGFYQKIKRSIKKIDNIAPKIIGEIHFQGNQVQKTFFGGILTICSILGFGYVFF